MSDEYSSSLHRASAEYRDFDLPPPNTKRWVTRRKAVIVNAVRTGAISLEEVCRRYELSVEEFLSWERAIDAHGVPGLRAGGSQVRIGLAGGGKWIRTSSSARDRLRFDARGGMSGASGRPRHAVLTGAPI
ncbi:MAG TPA: DUF1153 domain-containing protein [Candidatus Sulfotelmatobacter sp.]